MSPEAESDSGIERPVGSLPSAPQFGSDVVAQTLRELGVLYIALNPGASFRGLHDSLVNYLGNRVPQILLTLHEEHAVAIAQGYAKVTGKPLAVALHSNVGLFHATMAIFNAWCDRMPVLIIGATGPVDAVKRRPWIDWIHTARDQGAVVRGYVKWDDQPSSPGAARESLLRAMGRALAAPQGPVYVNFDAALQEAPLDQPLPAIEAHRYVSPARVCAAPEDVRRAAELLVGARNPLLLIGRTTRDESAWKSRIALAERLEARVVTDLKVGAAFPTDHRLHANAPGVLLPAATAETIADADVILSLDWVDLAGTLKTACNGEPKARIIHVSLDDMIHNGWSMDHQGLPPVDLRLAATPDAVVPDLLAALGTRSRSASANVGTTFTAASPASAEASMRVTTDVLALELKAVVGTRPVALAHLPLSWNGACWPFRHPLDYLGSDGGGGIGGGPGIAVGAALALKHSGRLPIAICGDGDFLMGATALWTAAHYRIPLLIVVANNRSFYNDEVHQERVARMRKRPVENKWIGQRISDPDIDLAAIARAQGARAFGPLEQRDALAPAFIAAVQAVDEGHVAVVDVRVEPGSTPAMSTAVTCN